MGAGVWAAGIGGKAIHSPAAPGTAYDDPAVGKDPGLHMTNYVKTTPTMGVYINRAYRGTPLSDRDRSAGQPGSAPEESGTALSE
jgi:hypothetical protein